MMMPIAACENTREFAQWVGGSPTPECDVAFVLNMLHHCDNEMDTLGT